MELYEDKLFLLSRFSPLYWEKFGYAYNKTDCNDPILNKNQIRALMIIGNRCEVSASQLGKIMYMRKSSITSIIDSLTEKGYVKKEANKMDRRSSILSLTDAGESYRADKYFNLHKELNIILTKLSNEDKEDLFNSLETATSIIKKL